MLRLILALGEVSGEGGWVHFVNVACNNKDEFRLATTGWCNSININGIKDCSLLEGEPPVAADSGDNSIISLKGGGVFLFPSGVLRFSCVSLYPHSRPCLI